jgi:hypothetical protein
MLRETEIPPINLEECEKYKKMKKRCGVLPTAQNMRKRGYPIDVALVWLAGSRRERK